MKAIEVEDEHWFMVKETKKWYKKMENDKVNTYGFQIGDNTKHSIPNNTEVEIQKKDQK